MRPKTIALILPALCLLASCENAKIGNQMLTGAKTYYYALVYSQVTETRYYHIQGWAEYGPDGIALGEKAGELGVYVGIELHLVNGDVVYRYEPGLCYELSKKLNDKYALQYGVLGE